jgi:hypothetical protein
MKVNQKEFVPNPGEEDKSKSSAFLESLKKMSLIRWLQLGVGGLFVGEYFLASGEWPVFVLGGFLLWQGLFNKQMGCAGRSCGIPKNYTENK